MCFSSSDVFLICRTSFQLQICEKYSGHTAQQKLKWLKQVSPVNGPGWSRTRSSLDSSFLVTRASFWLLRIGKLLTFENWEVWISNCEVSLLLLSVWGRSRLRNPLRMFCVCVCVCLCVHTHAHRMAPPGGENFQNWIQHVALEISFISKLKHKNPFSRSWDTGQNMF